MYSKLYNSSSHLEESVRHTTAGDDPVTLLDEVLNNENLVRDLGAADDGKEGPLDLLGVHDLRGEGGRAVE